MALYEFMIGLTVDTMINVEDLEIGFPAPKGKFVAFPKTVELGNGLVRGIGLPTAEWAWGFLKWNERSLSYRDALKVFVPGASAPVFIRTITNDNTDEYANFSAVAVWPTEETKDTYRRLGYTLSFRRLRAL